MQRDELNAIQEDLRLMLAERLNVRARTFHGAVRKAGRLLPAQARSAAGNLRALEARMDNPKLAARTDPAALRSAADTIRAALRRHKPGARAARDRSFFMAEMGAKIALLIAAVLIVARMRGGA